MISHATRGGGQIERSQVPAASRTSQSPRCAKELGRGRTDGRRQITVKAHTGETITAAEGFYVIAGHNPGVHGAVLTEALASRFAAQIRVTTDYDLARTLKIDPKAIRVARNLSTRAESGVIGWAPQLRELIAYQKIARVLGAEAAVANLIGIAPEEDRDEVAEVIRLVYGRTVTPLALGHQL